VSTEPGAGQTTILTCPKRQRTAKKSDPVIELRVYPRNSFLDNPKHAELRRSELSILDPETTPIPICDQKAWALAQKLHRSNIVSRLGNIQGISISRGEINQTIYRKFITDDPTDTRMLKGVEIAQYRIKAKLSQGEVEWFDAKKYQKKHAIPPQVSARRIATQRITGVDERLRIVATLAGPDWYFADSTNSIVVSQESPYSIEYILALLNSKLFQWRFKVTSTNNNVGTNELGGLPIRDIHKDDDSDMESYGVIVSAVKSALRSGEKQENTVSERAQIAAILSLRESLDAIDAEVAKLYSLTDEEIQIVEAASIIPQAAPIGEAAWAVPI
jgi:hypothetical protein